MIRPIALALAATMLAASPALAQEEQPQGQNNGAGAILNRILDRVLGPEETPAEPDATPNTPVSSNPLEAILAAQFRDGDRPRDRYRHPAETLAFFRVDPNHVVAEYAPGGGWYSRVLAPYIAPNGRYIAVNNDTSWQDLDAERRARTNSWPSRFAASIEEWTGVPASSVIAFESDEAPEELAGTVDRILIFRSLHGMRNNNIADSELRNLRSLLADDGLVGVVQHRAPAGETWARSNGTRGYLKQADVIDLFRLNGFELVSTSEINANPNDPANWEQGVWTLPPTLRLGDENRARHIAVGESDRMTLLFRKAR